MMILRLPFLILIMLLSYFSYSQDTSRPVFIAKAILFSPLGASIEVIPFEKLGMQASFQHSVFRRTWRATLDFKYNIWFSKYDYAFIGPYIRFKDELQYEVHIGPDRTGFAFTIDDGFYGHYRGLVYGINMGVNSIFSTTTFEFNIGLGLTQAASQEYLFDQKSFHDFDYRLGFSLGLWKMTK